MTKHFPTACLLGIILRPGWQYLFPLHSLENKAQVKKMCKYARLSTKQKDPFSTRKIRLLYSCSISLLPLIVFIEVMSKLKVSNKNGSTLEHRYKACCMGYRCDVL